MTSWYNESLGLKVTSFVEQLSHSSEDLVSDTELLSELKKSNVRLVEYMSDHPDIFRQLLGYLTELPNLQDSPERQFKYPMVACELFQEAPAMMRMLLGNEEMAKESLNRLFSIMTDQRSMRSLLPSYFGRIFQTMCRVPHYESLVKYLKNNQHNVVSMVKNAQNGSVARCLKGLLIVDDKDSYGEIEGWSEFKIHLIEQIFELLRDCSEVFLMENLLDILVDMVQRNLAMYHKNELMAALLHPSRVNSLLSMAQQTQSYSISAVRLLTELLIHTKKVEGMEIQAIMDGFITVFEHNLSNLLIVLDRPTLKTLQLIEAVTQCLRLRRRILTAEDYSIFPRLFDMLDRNPECNLLHTKVDRLVFAAFEQEENQPLIDYLFSDFNIIGRTITNLRIEHRFKSHFGYIIRIARHYTSFKRETPTMTESIQKNKQLWTEFSRTVLEPYIGFLAKDLGSYNIEEKDNTNNPNLYTIKSNITVRPDQNKFVAQEAACVEQAPTSLISLDFMNDSNEIQTLKDSSSYFNLMFDRPKEEKLEDIQITPRAIEEVTDSTALAQPAAIPPPKSSTLPPPPSPSPGYVPGGISATKSFEDFMQKKRAELANNDGIKSRTPNKIVNISTSAVEVQNSGSARKKNRWQSADQPHQPQSGLNPAPQIAKEDTTKLELPIIHLFKIKKQEQEKPVKTRKICASRDHKLKHILEAINSTVVAI